LSNLGSPTSAAKLAVHPDISPLDIQFKNFFGTAKMNCPAPKGFRSGYNGCSKTNAFGPTMVYITVAGDTGQRLRPGLAAQPG